MPRKAANVATIPTTRSHVRPFRLVAHGIESRKVQTLLKIRIEDPISTISSQIIFFIFNDLGRSLLCVNLCELRPDWAFVHWLTGEIDWGHVRGRWRFRSKGHAPKDMSLKLCCYPGCFRYWRYVRGSRKTGGIGRVPTAGRRVASSGEKETDVGLPTDGRPNSRFRMQGEVGRDTGCFSSA